MGLEYREGARFKKDTNRRNGDAIKIHASQDTENDAQILIQRSCRAQ